LGANELFGITSNFKDDDDFIGQFVKNDLPEKSSATAGGTCPLDKSEMTAYEIPCAEEYEKTVLDVCPKCMGIWVDGNELSDLRQIMIINKKHNFSPVIEAAMDTPMKITGFVKRALMLPQRLFHTVKAKLIESKET
jgi:Zn-finger nucleic acid-binding protein